MKIIYYLMKEFYWGMRDIFGKPGGFETPRYDGHCFCDKTDFAYCCQCLKKYKEVIPPSECV